MTIRRLVLAGLAMIAACSRQVPRADGPNVVTITTSEYAFGMPDTIPAGLTTFRLVNRGKELHHASLVRLRDGKTVADFQAGLAAAMQSHTPPPSWMTFAGGPNAVTLGDTGVATETPASRRSSSRSTAASATSDDISLASAPKSPSWA